MSESDAPPTAEIFAKLVQRLLMPVSPYRWLLHSQSFTLFADTDGNQVALPLSDLFKSYLAAPSHRKLFELQKTLHAYLLPPSRNRLSETLSTLFPCIRSYMALKHDNDRVVANAPPESEDELVLFPYADVLGVGLIVENNGTHHQVCYSDLERLGLSAEEAIEIAVENLSRISLDPFRLVQAGFYASPWKDSHDGARLLLTELFAGLKVEGELVAMTPTSETLLVTGSEDAAGMALMMSLSTTLIKEPNATHALPLVLRDGIWTAYIVSPGDPNFDTVHSYRMNVLNMLYGEQERYLISLKMERPKVFVSPFLLERDKKSGYVFSKTSIVDGAVNSFPECDIIEFYRQNAQGKKYCAARGTFKKVVEQLFLFLIEDRNLRPIRWRIKNFPGRSELDVIGTTPAGKGLWSPAQKTQAEREREALEALVNIPIPGGARLTSSSDAKDKESTLEFSVSDSIDALKSFYLQKLNVGNALQVPTEQGEFMIAEAIGAAWAREAWFGPGKERGETALRLIKRVNFNTPAVNNAFIKQTDILRSFEQLFGISLLPKMKPIGALTLSKDNAVQDFSILELPETVIQFFRIQMSGPRTIYNAADQLNPHLVINLGTGLIVAINPERVREGTQFSLSQSLESART